MAELPGYIGGRNADSPLCRIVHVIASVDPATGGPATVVVRLAAAQAAMGHHVTVISSLDPERAAVFQVATREVPNLNRVTLALNSRPSSCWDLLVANYWLEFEAKIGNADVLHLHGVWDVDVLAAACIARAKQIPYIVRPCGMLDPWSLHRHRIRKAVALRLTYRRMLEEAGYLHLLNDSEARLLGPMHLRTPIRIIPNGVFSEELRAGRNDEFLQRFPALRGKRYILFLSRLHYKKGLDLLAHAFLQLAKSDPDIDLVVAGPDEGAQADFEKMIRVAGVGSRVHLVGPLYGAEKLSALRHAACFCLPSRQEGFSLAVTEALACGVPVAVSRDAHFPEVVAAGAGTEFNLEVSSIVKAIDRLIHLSDAARRKMSLAGIQLVERAFLWPQIAQSTLQLYLAMRKNVLAPPYAVFATTAVNFLVVLSIAGLCMLDLLAHGLNFGMLFAIPLWLAFWSRMRTWWLVWLGFIIVLFIYGDHFIRRSWPGIRHEPFGSVNRGFAVISIVSCLTIMVVLRLLRRDPEIALDPMKPAELKANVDHQDGWVAVIAAIIITGIFIVDLNTPNSRNIAVFYLIPLAMVGLSTKRFGLWGIVVLLLALMTIGYVISPMESISLDDLHIVAANRVLAAGSVLILAVLYRLPFNRMIRPSSR